MTRSGTSWTERTNLTASDGAAADTFGYSISLDGETLVIGAAWDNDNGAGSGGINIFTSMDGSDWTEQVKLSASDGDLYDEFGSSVAISGNLVAVGARYDDDNGVDSESVYVFEL